jgi:acyl carrier protein
LSDEIFRKVNKIAAALFDVPAARITAESNPDTLEAWDSVQQLNLVLELEQEFNVSLDPDDIEQMQSIGAIVRIIEAKQST